jgi:hypothetical protein
MSGFFKPPTELPKTAAARNAKLIALLDLFEKHRILMNVLIIVMMMLIVISPMLNLDLDRVLRRHVNSVDNPSTWNDMKSRKGLLQGFNIFALTTGLIIIVYFMYRVSQAIDSDRRNVGNVAAAANVIPTTTTAAATPPPSAKPAVSNPKTPLSKGDYAYYIQPDGTQVPVQIEDIFQNQAHVWTAGGGTKTINSSRLKAAPAADGELWEKNRLFYDPATTAAVTTNIPIAPPTTTTTSAVKSMIGTNVTKLVQKVKPGVGSGRNLANN